MNMLKVEAGPTRTVFTMMKEATPDTAQSEAYIATAALTSSSRVLQRKRRHISSYHQHSETCGTNSRNSNVTVSTHPTANS